MEFKQRIAFMWSVVLFAIVAPAEAWHQHFHCQSTRAAVSLLPDEVPAYFRHGSDAAAHHSVDPDLVRDKALPQLRSGEGPEHYFDIELLNGSKLPGTRYELIEACTQLKVKPHKIGMLPYAIVEQTQRLTIAFAEHRQWPDNPHIRAKCMVIAGHLAHYVGDATQPLHVTVHFDGRMGEDGVVPHTGIHQRVDMLVDRMKKLDRIKLDAEPLINAKMNIEPGDKLMTVVWQHMLASHALVDRVYELEPHFPPLDGGPWEATAEVRQFARERMRATIVILARLYLTAWRESASLKLPHWLVRQIRDD